MANQKELSLVDIYLEDVEKIVKGNLLTANEEQELAKRIELGDQEAKYELARRNLRLVVSIAKRYIGKSPDMPLMDLIQEGNLGLLKAAERFDWRKKLQVFHLRQMVD